MYVLNLDPHKSGCGSANTNITVDAAAFQILQQSEGNPVTMTVQFFNNEGRPVNCYTGVTAVAESRVVV